MLDKIRMKKVHYQDFGRNPNLGPPKSSSLSVLKKPTLPNAKSAKVIKSLQAIPRKPSRGSNTAFSNVDYNYQGNVNDIHHLLRARNPSGIGAVHQPVPLAQLNFEVGLRTYKQTSDAGHTQSWTGAVSTHSLLDRKSGYGSGSSPNMKNK